MATAARSALREGRYIAPANYPELHPGRFWRLRAATLLIRAPWFARLDVGVSKRFALKGASSIEVAFEVLNLFDNINFNPVADPGGGETSSPPRHLHGSEQHVRPGRPPGQLMFRINW